MCRKEENKARLIFSLICPLKKEGTFIQGQNSSAPLKKQQVMRQHMKQKERFGVCFWIKNILWMMLFFYFGIIWFSEVLNTKNYFGGSRSFITSENQALFLWWRTMWTPISLFSMLHTSSIYLGNPLPPPIMLKNTILFYQFKKIIVFFFPKKSG